jgi:hypothetical protein
LIRLCYTFNRLKSEEIKMPRGGKRPGAGRKLGSVSKLSREAAQAEFDKGMTPLEFFTSVMRDPEQPLSIRLDAAKAAAPYMHSRLAAVEIAGKPEKPQNEPEPTTLEIARRLAFILAAAREELKEQNPNQFNELGDYLAPDFAAAVGGVRESASRNAAESESANRR